MICVPSIRDDSGNVDGLPNVVLEALASGTPLITTAAGGIGAVVDDNVTAIVVPERNAAAIAAALVGLVADPDRARQIPRADPGRAADGGLAGERLDRRGVGGGQGDPRRAADGRRAGRALVQARFGWERAAERLEAAYTRALALKSLPS